MGKRLAGDHETRVTVCGECKHSEKHPERDGKLLCRFQSKRISVDPNTYCCVTLMGWERKESNG